MQIREFDTIPLPTDAIAEKQPVERDVTDHPAWPNEVVTLYFDYNEAGAYWTWSAEMDGYSETFGPLVGPAPASYGRPYRFRDYCLFMFLDIARNANAVTPRTLGDTVDLIAIPGPGNPGYLDWIERQTTGSSNTSMTSTTSDLGML